jgi:anti-sigma-K factor RskA
MKLGTKRTLVSAYSAVATVALGLLAYDGHSRRDSAPETKLVAKLTSSESQITRVLAAISQRLTSKPRALVTE